MFTHNLDPILLSFGFLEVRWYGLIFALGFILIYYLLPYLAQKRDIDFSKEDASDFLLYLILGVVLGARLFYIIFYNLGYFILNPLDIFAVWQGGLSFHGGLAGAMLATFLFCKKKKMHFYDLADIIVIPAAAGLILGRIANFINGELVGRITSIPWCVNFPGYEGCRHPSQLYESAKNAVIFFILWHLKEKKLRRGILFWSFVVMYSTLRFFIGFLRAPDPQLGLLALGLTMGQWLNIAMFAIGLVYIRKINSTS
jgi:phosphatidylglycerol:prolipoprotein diacylglycerol transferase